MKNLYISLSLCAITLSALACEHGLFPSNELFIPKKVSKGMQIKDESSKIIKNIQALYDPIFEKNKKKLFINFQWDNPAVNAYATYNADNNPVITITAGLFGHELLTLDGLVLILCHEIGHFLGGEPRKLRGTSGKKSWSSAEGQADYYATATCARKVFRQLSAFQADNKFVERMSSGHLRAELNSLCKDNLCKRIALASLNVAEVYAAINFFLGELSLIRKDDYTTYQTIYAHPNPQCRLDTMIAAMLCPDAESISFTSNDPSLNTCQDINFRRPRCWYYPSIAF